MSCGNKRPSTSGVCVGVLSLLLALGGVGPAWPAERLRVVGLFAGKAMVEIDGRNRLLQAGERSPEGVLLISSTAREAVIEMDGERSSYTLGSHVGSGFAKPVSREVQIWSDHQGAYRTVGSINGQTTDMLVDTGATSVAMSEVEARRLGIQYRLKGERTGVRTASGYARAHSLLLDRVRVGEIELHQVEAVVIEGSLPQQVLLGMSFLKRIRMENKGTMLLLRTP